MKKCLILLLMFCLVLPMGVWASESPTLTLYIDQAPVALQHPMNVKDGHTLVPLRALSERLGFTVTWQAPVITITDDETTIVMTTNETKALVNEKEQTCPRAPEELICGVTYVPVRFLCEALGMNVYFSGTDNRIDITRPTLTQKIMKQLPKDENYMISPQSLEFALAMAANGAEGETQQEILDLLEISNLEEYNNQTKEQVSESNDNLSIANSIWLNKEYIPFQGLNISFAKDYQTIMKSYFNADAKEVDNKTAVSTINNWISDKTKERIKDVLSDPDFGIALVNTVYFKDAWATQFYKEATQKGAFTCADGTKTEKDMMHQTNHLSYYEQGDAKAIALPYEKSGLVMILSLSDQPIDPLSCYATMKSEWVNVTLPKFKTEFDVEYTSMLQKLGIRKAFSDQAEFSNLLKDNPIDTQITSVLQKTFIEVDENGTEAAAATAVIIGVTSMPVADPKSFVADRPFTYYIIDPTDGQVWFAGTILK